MGNRHPFDFFEKEVVVPQVLPQAEAEDVRRVDALEQSGASQKQRPIADCDHVFGVLLSVVKSDNLGHQFFILVVALIDVDRIADVGAGVLECRQEVELDCEVVQFGIVCDSADAFVDFLDDRGDVGVEDEQDLVGV